MLTNVPVHAKAPAAAAVLDGSGLVHGYLSYAVGTRNVLELLRLWWAIRRWRPEVVVYLAAARGVAAARRDAWFFRLCGVRRMVGVPLTEEQQVSGAASQRVSKSVGQRVSEEELEPEAARLGRCVAELGEVRLEERESWELRLSDGERAAARLAIGREALGLQPIAAGVGTKVQAKDWGKENWRSLLGRLAVARPGRALLMVGAAEEFDAAEFAAQDWRANGGGPVVNLCGRLTPRESAAALAEATLFVGHDSGPMHLAAAVGTRVLAVFAARNLPRQWFPYGAGHRVVYHRVSCAGCGLEVCVEEGKRCLLSITVEEVLAAVLEGVPSL